MKPQNDDKHFSLSCALCDAGTDVPSRQAAIEAGWIDLFKDTGGLSWTWIGLCPDCRREEYGHYEPHTGKLTATDASKNNDLR